MFVSNLLESILQNLFYEYVKHSVYKVIQVTLPKFYIENFHFQIAFV